VAAGAVAAHGGFQQLVAEPCRLVAGQRRAGTALIARGEFSLVIIGLAGASVATLSSVATPYVFILAIVGPVLARFTR
jgi:Kef-type K+ transport system membrane component KefB